MTNIEIKAVLQQLLPDYTIEPFMLNIDRECAEIYLCYDRDIDDDDPNEPTKSLPKMIDGLLLFLC